MALVIGSEAADTGMSKAIYDQVDALLSPPLEDAVEQAPDAAKPGAQAALDAARDGWRKLSFAIANGVIGHLLTNLEVAGVQARGNINAQVSGATGSAAPGPHTHAVALTGTQANVTFTQSNDGTGRVR
jgi:hypothetical protein